MSEKSQSKSRLPDHLIPGNPGNSGGKPGRSGRPTSAFREACAETFDKYRLLDVAARIAAGDIEEQWFDQDGVVHSSPTKNSDRLQAIKWIATYAHGQPTQVVEHTGKDGGPIEFVAEAQARFQSRMDRITASLGAAAMPEGTE